VSTEEARRRAHELLQFPQGNCSGRLHGANQDLCDRLTAHLTAREAEHARELSALRASHEREVVVLRRRFDCATCGTGVMVDEDGCCVQCGEDATVSDIDAPEHDGTLGAEPAPDLHAKVAALTAELAEARAKLGRAVSLAASLSRDCQSSGHEINLLEDELAASHAGRHTRDSGEAPLARTYLNDDNFHPVTCVQCGHTGGLKVSLTELLIEMMEREGRNGFDRGWKACVGFFVDGNQALPPALDADELRRRAKLTRAGGEEEARKLEAQADDMLRAAMAASVVAPALPREAAPPRTCICAKLSVEFIIPKPDRGHFIDCPMWSEAAPPAKEEPK
jgi:hypothetical protein